MCLNARQEDLGNLAVVCPLLKSRRGYDEVGVTNSSTDTKLEDKMDPTFAPPGVGVPTPPGVGVPTPSAPKEMTPKAEGNTRKRSEIELEN